MSAKKFNTPFALLGDKVEIPTTAQIDGSVSFQQGYPFGYELDYTDPNTKDISRSKTNQLLFDITNAIREIQQCGVSEWSEEGKPYKINSLVYAPDGTVKQSLLENNNNDTTHSSWSNLINASILPTLDTQNVKLTGNQTIDGVKTFSSAIAGSINGNAATVTNGVYTTGNQTIDGVKTFSSAIAGSINGNAATVTNGVYTTGNQTIDGVKTFSSSPIVPTPTAGTQAVNKNYVDSKAGGISTADFTGSNQSKTTNGYQKLPGGLIIQWGYYSSAGTTASLINFPVTFPNECIHIGVFHEFLSKPPTVSTPFSSGKYSNSQAYVRANVAGTGCFWLAIGH